MTGGEPVTMWFIDVDDLKQVNDRHGHDAGDVLLLSVARALEDVFPRRGGRPALRRRVRRSRGLASPEQLAERRQRLDRRLARALGAPGLPVGVSTGTAVAEPGQSLTDLLATADAAMYLGKQAKRTPPVRAQGPVSAPPAALRSAQ
jgi:diguanylate cyclase (GGDEF)-like protein